MKTDRNSSGITFVSDHLEGVEIVLNDVLLFVHKLAAVEELQ